jgi:TonB family protein
MSAMRTGVLLCSTLVALCLAVQPAAQATAPAGRDEPSAGERPAGAKIPVVPFWHVEVRPRPVFLPEAEYPEAARKAHIEALVVVEALVDVDGSIADTRILRRSRNRSLDEASLAAAREAKFSPAMARDPLVKMWVTIPYRFVLTSGKGTALARSISSVTTEPSRATGAEVKSHNDSVLKPLHDLKFVRLKPIAPRDGAHGRLVPDSAAIRFNNEAMMAAGVAFGHRRGDSLRKPPSYYLRSDWYYLVIDSGRCRVFQRNHPHYASSRAAVYDIDTLMVKPGSLDTNYIEMPDWTALPQYVPLRLEFDGRVSRTIQAPTFRLEVR